MVNTGTSDDEGNGDSGGEDGGGGDTNQTVPRRKPPAGHWKDQVDFAAGPGGQVFAYSRRQVLTTRVDEALRNSGIRNLDVQVSAELGQFSLLDNVADPLSEVGELRRVGILAQPNHVFFAHSFGHARGAQPNPVFPTPVFPTPVFPTGVGGCGCCCSSGCPPHPSNPCGGHHGYSYGSQPNPVFPTPVFPTPIFPTPVFPTPVFPTPVFPTGGGGHGCGCGGGAYGPTPVFPTPVFPTPVFPTPVFPTPVFPTPVFPTQMRSSVRPAPADADVQPILRSLASAAATAAAAAVDVPRVIVLDTGLAMDDFLPNELRSAPVTSDDPGRDIDAPDEDLDGSLDPVAGHGTFIAGIVNQVAPGCEILLHRVISTFGWCPEDAIVDCINNLPLDPSDRPEHTILSLSFGGYTLDYPDAMAAAIANVQALGVVVVASAGNDGRCDPTYPAAFPDVVSVGAIGPDGPAPFTNYGPWVRACAPGVDILSTYFTGFEGSETPPATGSGQDPDNFAGWALWSGTSFSAPLVAGALARTMMTDGCNAKEAVERVVDARPLMRIPNLGTVVNVI